MKPREDIKVLTLIRFVSAFLVLAYHFFKPGDLPGLLQNVASNGYKGVVCFFMMSGFILHHVYPDIKNHSERVKFWMARVYRIAPATLISLSLFVILSTREHGVGLNFFASVFSNLFGLSAWTAGPLGLMVFNTVTWTISVEAFFYLLYPVLCDWVKGMKLSWVVGALVVNCVLMLLRDTGSDAFISLTGSKEAYFLPILWLPYFVHGILLRRLVDLVDMPKRAFWPEVALSLGMFGLLMLPHDVLAGLMGQGAFIVLFSGVLLLSRNTEVAPGWVSSTFLFLGQASFSTYLFQFWYPLLVEMLFKKLHRDAPSALVSPVGHMAGALVLGIAAYLLIEDPARKALVKMAKWRSASVAAAPVSH